jgi:putative MATE family efflux protein
MNPMQNRERNVLDTDKIGRLLVTLSLPAFFGMFVQTLYNVVNTIFIGHFVGPLAIAGLSIVFPLQMLSMGIGMMVGLGGTSLISRSIGAGDNSLAERALGNGVTSSIVFSVILMLIILPNVDFWLRLIGASEEVLPFARDYLVIIMGGAVFNAFAMALLNLVRGEGNARVGMSAMILGAVLNIILDAILIVWLRLGVKGAAIGTVTAQIVSLLYLLSYYFSGSSYLKIRTANLRPDFKILRAMLAIGSASFAQTVAGSLSAMFVIRTVVTFGGDLNLSAFGILQRIMMFALMPAIVIGQGLQPVLGFNYGARHFRLALKSATMAYIAATLLSIVVWLILRLFPGPIISVFTTDNELISAAIYAAHRAFVALPVIGVVMVGSASFQSIGKARQAFITAICRPIVFLIPSVLILPRFFQLDGVWFSFPVADTLTFVLVVILTLPVLREFRKAAAAETQPPAGELAGAPL